MAKSQDQDTVEIEIDEKTSVVEEEIVKVEPAEEVAKADSGAQTEDNVDDSIRELKEQLERERQARVDAEKRAREAAKKATQASGDVHDTNLQLLDTAINTVKNDTQMLKERYKAALAANDYDSVADIQEAMSSNAAKLMQLENGKMALEARPRPTYDIPDDPVESLASQLSPRSADWVRKNPQFVTDPRLNQKMVAAHNMAIADGYAADTDEYFEYVEDVLKVSKQSQRTPVREQDESSLSSASAPTQRRSAPPAAPVSRNPTNSNGVRQNVVRLTSAEREMAQMMGMTDQEYAKNKAQLIKEGKLPH